MSGMVGTPEAYTLCARCRHARIRHTNYGAGPCAAWLPQAQTTWPATSAPFTPCDCPGYVTTITEGGH